jgi:hypothetical protein
MTDSTKSTTPTLDERVSRLEDIVRILGLQRLTGEGPDELAAGGASTISIGCPHSAVSNRCLAE